MAYTSMPELRNQGLARAAVAMHLTEVAAQGVRHAILFAANPAAARAYEGIGFERRGTIAVALFEEGWEV